MSFKEIIKKIVYFIQFILSFRYKKSIYKQIILLTII